jgi:hypothetical protein
MTFIPGREHEILTSERIKEIHAKYFTFPFDINDIKHRQNINNPTLHGSFTNDISRKDTDLREVMIVSNIVDKWNLDYDVFIVYGSSH